MRAVLRTDPATIGRSMADRVEPELLGFGEDADPALIAFSETPRPSRDADLLATAGEFLAVFDLHDGAPQQPVRDDFMRFLSWAERVA